MKHLLFATAALISAALAVSHPNPNSVGEATIDARTSGLPRRTALGNVQRIDNEFHGQESSIFPTRGGHTAPNSNHAEQHGPPASEGRPERSARSTNTPSSSTKRRTVSARGGSDSPMQKDTLIWLDVTDPASRAKAFTQWHSKMMTVRHETLRATKKRKNADQNDRINAELESAARAKDEEILRQKNTPIWLDVTDPASRAAAFTKWHSKVMLVRHAAKRAEKRENADGYNRINADVQPPTQTKNDSGEQTRRHAQLVAQAKLEQDELDRTLEEDGVQLDWEPLLPDGLTQMIKQDYAYKEGWGDDDGPEYPVHSPKTG